MTKTEKTPKVGDGVTYSYGSDCYPGTIVEVSKSGKSVIIQDDNAEPAEGFDYYSNQVYIYSPNKLAGKQEFTLRKNGRYVSKGQPLNGTSISIGVRRKYQDPHF